MASERQNFLAYSLLFPALAVMTLCGVLPLGFVAYYSVHDTFGGNDFFWVGGTWFRQILVSPEFLWALARSLGFSALVLGIEIPLGLYIALRMACPYRKSNPNVMVVESTEE